ncbi:hypothetical protein JCM3775_003011 [Rhodotorula graminis]
MIELVRRIEDNEIKMFKMHLDEQQNRLPAQAVLELEMVIEATKKLVDQKESAFARVAHVWSYRKKSERARRWNAAFEQAADNQYINLELFRARLRALEELASHYRRLSRPQRASPETLLVPGAEPVERGRSASSAKPDLENYPRESASGRSSTPVPQGLDAGPRNLGPYTPGARTGTVRTALAQPRRASEATPPSLHPMPLLLRTLDLRGASTLATPSGA